jgi:hypothetical protein
MENSRQTPGDDREPEGLLGTEAIDNWANDQLSDRIRKQKGRRYRPEFSVAEPELLDDHRTRDGERLTIKVIYRRDQAQKDRDLPANWPAGRGARPSGRGWASIHD